MSEAYQDIAEQKQESHPPQVPFTTAEASAGFGIRLGAKLLDHLFVALLAIPGAIIGIIVTQTMGMRINLDGMDPNTKLMYYGLAVVEIILYFIIAESLGGVTLGKSKLGLKVVNEDFGSANPIKIIIRNLLYFVDGAFFGLVAFAVMRSSKLKQRVGDILAKTVVVYDIQIPYEKKEKLGSAKLANWLAVLFVIGFEAFRHIMRYT